MWSISGISKCGSPRRGMNCLFPNFTSLRRTAIFSSALVAALGLAGCQTNSNADLQPNGRGKGDKGDPGDCYKGTGSYDPKKPPKGGFGSHLPKQAQLTQPLSGGSLLAAIDKMGPSPKGPVTGVGANMLAWGGGGGGGEKENKYCP